MTQGTYHFSADDPEAYERMKRRQALAESMLSRGRGRAPRTVGEGLYVLGESIGQGLAHRSATKRLDEMRTAAGADATATFDEISGGASAFPPVPDAPGEDLADDVAYTGFEPHQRALLNTISGPESAGSYNVRYGGARFDGFGDHPRIAETITSGPNKGKKSTAAGRYQFLANTWDDYAGRMKLADFSPKNQDLAAWELAKDAYRANTGGDLDKALLSGDPGTLAGVGKALSGTWTSLPTGIEAQLGTDSFVNAYQGNLAPRAPRDQGASLKPAPSAREAIDAAFQTVGLDDSGQSLNIPAHQVASLGDAGVADALRAADQMTNDGAPTLMASSDSDLLPIIRGASKQQLDAMDPSVMSMEERAAATKRYREIGDELESSLDRPPVAAPAQPQITQPARPITPTPPAPPEAAPQAPVARGGALPPTISPSMDERMQGTPPLEAPRTVESRPVAGARNSPLAQWDAFVKESGSQQLAKADPTKGLLGVLTGMAKPGWRPGFPPRPGAGQLTAENAAQSGKQLVANAMVANQNKQSRGGSLPIADNPFLPESTKLVASAMLGQGQPQAAPMQFASLDPSADFRTALAQPESSPESAAMAMQGIPAPAQPANDEQPPMEVAQARQLTPQQVRKLYAIASNPAYSPGDRAMARHYLQQHQAQQMSPLQQLQLEKARRDLNTAPKREMFKDANGRHRWTDTQELVVPDLEIEPEFRDLTPEEIKARNLPEGNYQIGRDGRLYPIRSQSTGISFTTADGTEIQIGGSASGLKQEGKNDANQLKEAQAAAASSSDLKQTTSMLRKANKTSGYKGPGAGLIGAADDILESLGGNLPGTDRDQSGPRAIMRAGGLRVALDNVSKTKGAISNAEMGLFMAASPGMQTTEAGNAALLDMIDKIADRTVMRATAMETWLNEHQTLRGFSDAWETWLEENPLIVETPDGSVKLNDGQNSTGETSSGLKWSVE